MQRGDLGATPSGITGAARYVCLVPTELNYETLLGSVMPVKPKTWAERFWVKVKKLEGDGCWEWMAGRTPKSGYGLFAVSFKPSKCVVAHRISYMMECGPIPDGMVVCHRCDNPPCVRPDHLFLGTRQDNIEDMRVKGRAAKGTKHFRSKLDGDKVRDIRKSHAAGESPYQIALRLGVRAGTVYAVISGKTWSHVPLEGLTENG